MRRNFDIIIVGAGPAGASLAGELAAKGLTVAILEKEKLPRYKCCAGGLSVRTAKLLSPEILSTIENEITGSTFTLSGDKSFIRRTSKPVGFTVTRSRFDYALTKQAEKAGAVVLEGHQTTGLRTDNQRVHVFNK